MMGALLTHAEITAPVEQSCDVCIVGSGAGGAVLAAGLVERGLSVVMLEEGSHRTRRDFDLHEGRAFQQTYQERGTRATADLSIAVLQGRSVGGSTTINWTTCYRTPERILAHWRTVHGLELDAETLRPHFEAVEARLGIHEWPESAANANNQVLFRGCRALGYDVAPMRRNVRGCVSSGYCGVGCPVDGKQAMGITYLPDALHGGLLLYANTRVERLEVEGGRVVAVHGRVIDPDAAVAEGPAVVVRPKVCVSAAGALNGPMLLLRSGLGELGPVGRRTFLHPVVGISGRYEEEIAAYYGVPQAAGSHHFIDRGPDKIGFFLEVTPGQPMLISTAFKHFGAFKQDVMAQLPHVGVLISLSVDGLLPGDEGGTVGLRPDGRMDLQYPIRPALAESFRASHHELAKIALAAGAVEVTTLHTDRYTLRSEADLAGLDGLAYGAHEHAIFTAHQMGGCAMGVDPQRSVVRPDLRHHHVENLFVVDGSVFPTSLGVNPSESIYGLAHWATPAVAAAV